jgi:hypothetical protein
MSACFALDSHTSDFFYFYGYEKTWNLWNIPTLLPPFLDFQLLPASAESIRAGYNPAMENPFDPEGWIFNYPQIWYLILRTPINFEWTIPLALVLIALFFISVALFPVLYRTNVVASSITAKQPPFNSIFLSFGDCHAAENPSAARNDIV